MYIGTDISKLNNQRTMTRPVYNHTKTLITQNNDSRMNQDTCFHQPDISEAVIILPAASCHPIGSRKHDCKRPLNDSKMSKT